MMPRIVRSAEAEQDLEEIALFIARSSPQNAFRFLDAGEEAFRFLGEMPELGSIYETRQGPLKDLRCWSIKGFSKHLVFYRIVDEGIEIVRVLHGARDLENLPPPI